MRVDQWFPHRDTPEQVVKMRINLALMIVLMRRLLYARFEKHIGVADSQSVSLSIVEDIMKYNCY